MDVTGGNTRPRKLVHARLRQWAIIRTRDGSLKPHLLKRRANVDDELAGVCQSMGDAAEAGRFYNDALKDGQTYSQLCSVGCLIPMYAIIVAYANDRRTAR